MSSVCCTSDHLQFLSGKKARPSLSGFHEALDLSPTTTTAASTLRRLLLRRADSLHSDCSLSPSEAYALQRFLPSNHDDHRGGGDEGEEAVPDDYACDEFRMYEFKVRRCTRGRSHDWTDCPFAHPGEKARRRDPRRFTYSASPCPDFRKGVCRRGDACEFAHGVFECWLHPSRYRTQPCKDGLNCRRKVCFFAHTPQQLRMPTGGGSGGGGDARGAARSPRCCACCSASKLHQWLSQGGSSPNSPLMVGVSQFSPPASPPPLSASPASPFFPAYQNMISDLAGSFDCIDINSSTAMGGNSTTSTAIGGSTQGSLSWSTLPSISDRRRPSYSCSPFSALWKFQEEEEEEMERERLIRNTITTNNKDDNITTTISDPDFEWVNELVM